MLLHISRRPDMTIEFEKHYLHVIVSANLNGGGSKMMLLV